MVSLNPRQVLVLVVALALLTPVAVANHVEDHDPGRPDDVPPPRGTDDDFPENETEDENETGTGDDDSGRGRGRGGDDAEDARDEDEDEEEDDSQGRGRGRGRGGDDEDDDDDRRPEWTEDAGDHARRENAANARGVKDAVGRFDVTEGSRNVTGTYVAFSFNDSSITGVTVQGLPVFNAFATVDPDEDDDETEVESRGAQIRIETRGFELRAHDNPGAVFKMDDADAWELAFPAGSNLTTRGAQLRVTYPSGDRADLLSEDGWVVNGTTAFAEDKVTFVLHAAKGAFDKHRAEIANAVGNRTVGAEVTVVRSPGDSAAEADAVTFANVTVETLAQLGNVTFVVDGHGFDGRVLVMNVDPALFNASSASELTVLFDGGDVAQASSLLDVLDPDDDGLAPEYWIVEDANGYQVIFSVPHYSVHTMSLLDAVTVVPPSVTIGLVASVIVVAAGAFVLFRGPPRARA